MPGDYYIAAAYLRLLIQGGMEVLELTSEELGAELIDAANAEYVPGRLINQLYEILESYGFDSWVTRYGAQLGVGSHGPLGFAALSAPDLGTALATLTDFLVIRTSAFDTNIREQQNRLELILSDNTNHPVAGRWIIESGFLVIKGLIETIILHPLGNNSTLSFAYPMMNSHRQLEKLFKISCAYDSAENILSIPAAWGRIPSPLSDPDAFRTNVAKCREIKLNLDSDRSDVLKLVNARLLSHFARRLSNQSYSEKIPRFGFARRRILYVTPYPDS